MSLMVSQKEREKGKRGKIAEIERKGKGGKKEKEGGK